MNVQFQSRVGTGQREITLLQLASLNVHCNVRLRELKIPVLCKVSQKGFIAVCSRFIPNFYYSLQSQELPFPKAPRYDSILLLNDNVKYIFETVVCIKSYYHHQYYYSTASILYGLLVQNEQILNSLNQLKWTYH